MIKECQKVIASCICRLENNHKGNHVCPCEGSWKDNGDITSLPNVSLGFGAFPLSEKDREIINKNL